MYGREVFSRFSFITYPIELIIRLFFIDGLSLMMFAASGYSENSIITVDGWSFIIFISWISGKMLSIFVITSFLSTKIMFFPRIFSVVAIISLDNV